MTRHHTSVLPRLLALSLALSSPTAFAGDYNIEFGGGEIVPILNEIGDRYVDAMARAILAGTTPFGPDASNTKFRSLRAKLRKATLARFDYTYADTNSVSHTRIVYSSSGHPHSMLLTNTAQAPGSSTATSPDNTGVSGTSAGESTSGLSDDHGLSWDDEVDIDRRDSQFFADDTADFKRAPRLSKQGSQLRPTTAEQIDRSGDAEYRGLRQLEADIDAGIIPKNGKLTGYVSKAPCESCSTVIEDFADRYTSGTNVYYLAEGSSGASSGDSPLARSIDASNDLVERRKKYLNQKLIAGRTEAPVSRRFVDRFAEVSLIEEEDAGRRVGNAEGCAPAGTGE